MNIDQLTAGKPKFFRGYKPRDFIKTEREQLEWQRQVIREEWIEEREHYETPSTTD